MTLMKAIVYTHYGSPDVLQFQEIEKPVVKDNEILVQVHAASVNRTDCATVRAKPFFMRVVTGLLRPRKIIPGTEFSGVIEAVGKDISSFTVGEKVFGFDDEGACSQAQYLSIQEKYIAAMPEGISYEQAAVSSEGAHYAYNFINKVDLEPGQTILVNGATGAIGSAAVQLLKNMGMNVTAVCGTKNISLVQSFGADKVIDYQSEDFTRQDVKYNHVFDTVGKSSFFKCRHLLKEGGVYISSELGYMSQNLFLPLITMVIKPLIGNRRTIVPVPFDISKSLLSIKSLIEQGRFTAVIDSRYPLEETAEAFRYVEKGQKVGSVVITVDHENY